MIYQKLKKLNSLRSAARTIIPSGIRPAARALLGERRNLKELNLVEALAGEASNLATIEHYLVANFVPVRQPMIMISQAMRSGGTLLSQLFDDHPQVLMHPFELKTGYPGKWDWPPISPSKPASENFRYLFEPTTLTLLKRGYSKGERDEASSHPFLLVPSLQRAVFEKYCERFEVKTNRDIFNAYFTSYFNAWLNYRGLIEDTRYVSAFLPRLSSSEVLTDEFFDTWPDGHMISVLRDPLSFYASAKQYGRKYQETEFTGFDQAMGFWRASAEGMLRNAGKYGDRLTVVCFEELTQETRSTMTHLCTRLGLDFDKSLLMPTFNGRAIKANSSFEVTTHGLTNHHKDRLCVLDDEEKRIIAESCTPLYETVRTRLAVGSSTAIAAVSK